MAKNGSSRRRFVQDLHWLGRRRARRRPRRRCGGAAVAGARWWTSRPRANAGAEPADQGLGRAAPRRAAEASGIPLGGIGTGSVEVRSDGHFHEWMIFNLGRGRRTGRAARRTADMAPGALAFFLWARPREALRWCAAWGRAAIRRICIP